jgi:hypothetical protein
MGSEWRQLTAFHTDTAENFIPFMLSLCPSTGANSALQQAIVIKARRQKLSSIVISIGESLHIGSTIILSWAQRAYNLGSQDVVSLLPAD